jgi:gliding motility-associated-like protein
VTSGAGCVTTIVQSNVIHVYGKPTSSFNSVSNRYCFLPAQVSFTNSASGNGPFTATWNFGDGTGTITGNNPTHTYTTAGVFTVTLVTTDVNGCKDSVVQPSYIYTHGSISTFSAPASVCDSSWMTASNTTSSPGFTTWNFGDGGLDTGFTVNHRYTTPGTYTIRMITNMNGCPDTSTHTIIVNPRPVAAISHNKPCPPPSSVQFTGTSNMPVTYNWSWASGGSATGANVSNSYTYARIDTAFLIATSAAGCSDTVRMDTVYVYDLVLFMGALPYQGCIPLTSYFGASIWTNIPCTPHAVPIKPYCPYPYPITSYAWGFDGVATSSAAAPNYTFTTTGIHYATLTVTTANGCTVSGIFNIGAGTKVPPSFTADSTPYCVKKPIRFTNTTGDSSIAYYWKYGENFGDDNNYHGLHLYTNPDTFDVTLISDFNGCYDTLTKPLFITVKPSIAKFRDSIFCAPSTNVQFVDTSVGATSHLWKFGDATTSILASPVHTYPSMGTYIASHITNNSVYGCSDTVTDTIVLVQPVLGFTAPDTAVCTGDSVHLIATYSGLPVWRYKWTVDGWYNPWDSVNNITLWKDTIFNNRGYYDVVFYVSTRGGRCLDSVRKDNYILSSHPVAAFGAVPVIGCTPLLVLFADSTSYTPGTYRSTNDWKFGDGGTASVGAQTTSHTYTTAGIFTVKLKVTDWIGCTDSLTKVGYITARHPTANFAVNRYNACVGELLSFSNTSSAATGLIYKWSFGDGDTSSAAYPYHAYAATGVYTVRLIVTDSTGCSDTLTRANYIGITRPNASFTLSDTLAVCPPLIVYFASTSTGASAYAWTFGNGNVAAGASPASTYTAPGIYNVRLIAIDAAGCEDTATAKIRVLGYSGALTYTVLSGCAPLGVQFTANITNVPVMVWDFADGDTALAVGTTASHTYLSPGAYVPKLIFYDGGGCSTASAGLDTIKVDGVIGGFRPGPLCEKTPVIFTDTSFSYFSPLNYWQWNFGTPPLMLGATISHVYPSTGTYPVTLIVSNSRGCRDTISTTVNINALPVIKAIGDTAVCIPDAITLSATGGVSYAWTPGASLSCTACPAPSAFPTSPTSYVVTGTDANGCAAKDTVRVGIQTKTTSVTGSDAEICLGQHYQLTAGGATVYSWSPAGTLSDPNISSPIATPTSTTTYMVVSKEGSCIADTHKVKVVVLPLPKVDAGADVTVIAGNSTILVASGTGIHHVYWEADPTLSCTNCFTTTATPKVTTTYYVTAYTERNCTSTDSVRVKVLCDGSQLFIPNTFTPNGDGQNDFFFARAQGIDHINSFRVYSRWGELLFDRSNMAVNDERAGWNGTYNGRILNPDVYVYVIEASCDTGEPLKMKGDITLIR